MVPEIEIQVREASFGGGLEFVLISELGGKRCYSVDVVFAPVEEGALHTATGQMDRQAAQQLMDSLWNCGIRPVGVRHKDETLKTMNDHLQDMRAITFDKLKVALPQT